MRRHCLMFSLPSKNDFLSLALLCKTRFQSFLVFPNTAWFLNSFKNIFNGVLVCSYNFGGKANCFPRKLIKVKILWEFYLMVIISRYILRFKIFKTQFLIKFFIVQINLIKNSYYHILQELWKYWPDAKEVGLIG